MMTLSFQNTETNTHAAYSLATVYMHAAARPFLCSFEVLLLYIPALLNAWIGRQDSVQMSARCAGEERQYG